jgi:hypothetical protein
VELQKNKVALTADAIELQTVTMDDLRDWHDEGVTVEDAAQRIAKAILLTYGTEGSGPRVESVDADEDAV